MIQFEHADVLDPAAGRLLKDRFVRVDGATIEALSEEPLPVPAGARVVNAAGRVLMPGLIDCHVHCLASQVNLGRLANLPNVLAVLMVEQRARQALAISDHAHILDQGTVVMRGRAADLLSDERMAQLYLGAAGHA